MITATPTLTVAGQLVPPAPVGGQLPALVGIDKLRTTWGRKGPLDAPTPSTAALSVLDTTAGATFARRTDLVGAPVVLGWSASTGQTGVTFRGRLTDVDAAPRAGGAGFRTDLAASSVEVDLANVLVPANSKWPGEAVSARLARLVALLPGGFAGGVLLPDIYDIGRGDLSGNETVEYRDVQTWPLGPLDASGRDLLSLLRQLFTSLSPLPMIYDPGADRLTFARLNRYGYAQGMTASARLLASPDHAGRYVAASLAGVHADAHASPYAGSAGQGLDSRVTRVEVKWPATADTNATTVRWTADSDAEPVIGRHPMTVDTMLGRSYLSALVGDLYADVAYREARTPALGPVTFTTAREPIHDAAHAAALLSGHERGSTLFLGRSWLPRLGLRPLVALIGGTVTYAGGQWSAQLQPAPTVINPAPFSWAPVTVGASAVPGVRLRDIDRSVTVGDMAYIDVGAGVDPTAAPGYRGNPA